jgi:DNA modification methylase
MKHEIIIGDCLDSLAELPADTFQTCITSPPYYQLRDYGVDGQIGLEDSLEEHISALVDVFRAVRRVLRPDGTLWLNYGDAYQDKQLLGLPWRLAFALQADGWWLRSDIIWHKPNPMPSSVTDRPTSSHEYMFLLSPSQKYFYDADAVREKAVKKIGSNGDFGNKNAAARNVKELTGNMAPGSKYLTKEFRNLRDVWTIPPHALSAAHFATFPPKLVEPCIKAGSRPGDKVLDPFGGAGTVGLIADRLGRDSTLLELNPEYAELARKRLIDDAPLLCEVKIL